MTILRVENNVQLNRLYIKLDNAWVQMHNSVMYTCTDQGASISHEWEFLVKLSYKSMELLTLRNSDFLILQSILRRVVGTALINISPLTH